MSEPSGIRVGTEEREQAMAALSTHFSAGRLSLTEFEDRSELVAQARTRGDLTAVFSDLPATKMTIAADPSVDVVANGRAADAWNPGWDWRAAVVGVLPFVALALFFLTSTWLWFLMIPAAGALLYGAVGRHAVRRHSVGRDKGSHHQQPGNTEKGT